MNAANDISPESLNLLVRTMHQSLAVRRHVDLLLWLQGDFQAFVPHDILIAAWGDFEGRAIHMDVVSPLTAVRTTPEVVQKMMPLALEFWNRWQRFDRSAHTIAIDEGFAAQHAEQDCLIDGALRSMRTALTHGLRDKRGRQDCLYMTFSSRPELPRSAHRHFEVLMPYLDSALRSVAHLPHQHPADEPEAGAPPAGAAPVPPPETVMTAWGLSTREAEIMHWVRAGKTNQEIGHILDISAFTVKNHLQRIFKKLDVMNRAQAVAKLAE